MLRKYIATFDTRRHRAEHHHHMIVEAANLKEARKEFELKYYNGPHNRKYPHPFHLKIRLLKEE